MEIERSKVLEACELFGFDPNDISEMTISPESVTVTTFKRGPEGQRVRVQGEGYGKSTTEYPISSFEYGADND